jgi:hypothetical protein
MAIDLQEFAVRGDKEGRMGGGGTWCYWRKPAFTDRDGKTSAAWIVAKPAWPSEFMRQMRKGWTPLMQYGEFHPDFIKFKGQSWHFHRDPYRLLLLKGGAGEFGKEQVKELGWHRKPPMGMEFPQLADDQDVDVVCATCGKKYLTMEDLQRHEQISHRELSSHKELGRQIGEATSGVMAGPMADAFKLLADAVTGIAERQQATDARMLALLEGLNPPAPMPAAPAAAPSTSPRK